MPTPDLLENFTHQTDNDLLKALLETYNSSSDTTQEQKVDILTDKLEEIFQERLNANHGN